MTWIWIRSCCSITIIYYLIFTILCLFTSFWIYIYKVNVDNERPLSRAFKIKSLPTLFLCPMNGAPRIVQGALPKEQLKTLIDTMLVSYN